MPRSQAEADGPPTTADETPAVDGNPPRKSRSASRGSSRASSAADSPPFFADPGSGFDAEESEAEAEPIVDEPPPVDLVLWTPERIRRLLTLQGQLTHHFAGVAEQDWIWLPHELDMVCGPLADFCNRVPALAAVAHLSDDAAIAAGFVSYATRSYLERVRELQRRRAQGAQPVTGRAADPIDVEPEEVPWTTPTA